MFPILMVVTFQGFLYQMATAQYTIQPIQNLPISNLNRQQLIQALLTTFDQPTTPQRLELLAGALQQVPPKKNRIYLAELLKQTALQTLKVAASVCNVAEFTENTMHLPQKQFTSAGYVLPNYVPEVTNFVPRKEVITNYVPEVLNNYVPRKEVITNYVPEVLNNYIPRKEIGINYVPEVLTSYVPRKEVITNYMPRKEVITNYVPDVLTNYVPNNDIVTKYVSDILGNYAQRQDILPNYIY